MTGKNYIQRKMIGFTASLAFALVYLPLRATPYGMDAAVCVSFTIVTFGNAMRKRGKGLFFGEERMPLLEMVPGHLLCLIFLAGIVEFGNYAAPVLPGWLTVSVGKAPGEHALPSALQGVQSVFVFLLGFVENWWLTSGKSELAKKGLRITWGKAAFEEDMSSRLRLK